MLNGNDCGHASTISLVGWGWEAGFDEDRPVSGQALTHTLDQHAANLGGCGEESNRMTRGDFVDSRAKQEPTRITRRGMSSGSSSARLGLSQKGGLPSSGDASLILSKVADARIYCGLVSLIT